VRMCVRRLVLMLARSRGNEKRISGGKCGERANCDVKKLLTAAADVASKCKYEFDVILTVHRR